jgi:hypothetical protein
MTNELTFWLYFLAINVLFFLPRYLLEWKHSTFFPYKGLLEGPVTERVRYLINRFNYDIFRVSVDWLVLGVLLVVLPPGGVGWQVLYFAAFVVLWSYQLYYHVMESVYRIEPVFYSDRLLLQTGFQLFFQGFNRMNLGITVGVAILFSLVWWLIGQWQAAAMAAQWSVWSYVLIAILGMLSLYSLFTYNYKAFGKIAFPSQVQSLVRNIRQSLRTRHFFQQFDFKAFSQHKPYAGLQLERPPNIYFLVIESYGRLALEDGAFRESVTQQLQQMQANLHAKGWHSTSALSEAPITGGASWISYTAALFGFPIRDQAAYLTLLHHPEMRKYQHLMRWLRDQGYRNYRLSPIAGFEDMKIPWDDYQDFYALDEWIKFEDFGYQGPLYGFGPCPPDQYSLGFAAEHIRQQSADPFFLFFITQNSHSPFTGPPRVTAHWKDLIDPTVAMDRSSSASIFSKPQQEDYKAAMLYQLAFIEDFIKKEGRPEDLFILIGDHQPPVFPGPEAGLETPIHIIHQSEDWIKGFEQYGFSAGMLPDMDGEKRYHEGLFSLLVREMVRQFGPEAERLPAYLRGGIAFETIADGRY